MFVAGCSAMDTEPRPGDESQKLPLTPEEAAASDRADAARDSGLSLDEVDAHLKKSADLKAATRGIRKTDIWVGATVGRGSADRPTVYLKGEAPEAALQAIAASETEIRVVDHQPYSLPELLDRKERLMSEVRTLGFKDASAYFDIKQEGQLFVTARRQAFGPKTAEELKARLSLEFQSIELRMIDEPVDRPDTVVGGTALSSNSGGCTAGFTVQTFGGATRGTTSAGHCDSMTLAVHTSPFSTHDLTLLDSYWAYHGDVAMFETDTTEPDDFWADSNELRDVISVGDDEELDGDDYVCGYSRMKDEKSCALVWSKYASCGPAQRYIVMDSEDLLVDGDSGGPWFWNYTAYGIHHGQCLYWENWKDTWTPVTNLFVLGAEIVTN